ncbi:uncharacterized protein J3D65DRAFT_568151 [Phyllosticta citribraziliensis]|uniref:Pentatricopeptide repeat-containing protein-mitochondrial domain-containing protein n=1 Tax=Phyllosticta citribraziliensis TaxID=989973 RepID=A0ABR1LW59_9PEZI
MSSTALILETVRHSLCQSLANASLRTPKASSTASLRRSTLTTCRRQPSAPRIQRAHQSSAAQANVAEPTNDTGTKKGPTTLRNSLRRAAERGEVEKAHHILSELLCVKRWNKPDLQEYSAAILVNCDAKLGSAGAIASLLKEVAEIGLEPNSEICHNVLKVLAVHPDYLLREAILEYMRQKWITIKEEGRHDIVVGSLRDRQFEMALEQIESMRADGVEVQPWLYNMAIHMLCEVEEADEAFRIVRELVDSGNDAVSKMAYYRLLDLASDFQNHEVTSYIWTRQVSHGYLIPSAGMCDNVLATAARHGDAGLASDVFRLIGERKQILTQYQYEMLVDTYVQARDIEKAASVLCIMHENGFAADEYSTRRLFRWARGEIVRPKSLFRTLRRLARDGRKLPLALVHVAMEASLFQKDVELAIEQYKALNSVCPGGPATETFNVLLRHLHGRKDLAMYLVAEMVERGIKADHLTHDRLLLVCLVEDDYEDAFVQYGEMRKCGFSPRGGTFGAMAKRCAAAGDERAWQVLSMMADCGIDERNIRVVETWLKKYWGTKLSQSDFTKKKPALKP